MTAKEYLEQIKYFDICIKQKSRELEDLKSQLYSVSAVDTNKERVKNSMHNTGYNKVDNSIDLEASIYKQKKEFIKLKHKIIDEIQGIGKKEYTDILHKRYVEFKSFETIAAEMGYSYRHITRLHGWALKKFGNTYLENT